LHVNNSFSWPIRFKNKKTVQYITKEASINIFALAFVMTEIATVNIHKAGIEAATTVTIS